MRVMMRIPRVSRGGRRGKPADIVIRNRGERRRKGEQLERDKKRSGGEVREGYDLIQGLAAGGDAIHHLTQRT
jgi:hypothetical protein